MIDELIERIWRNPEYHKYSQQLEVDWLRSNLRIPLKEPTLSEKEISKLSRAATILACSDSNEVKMSAYNVATYIRDLYRAPRASAIARVVLTRISNLPAISTKEDILNSGWVLPDSIAIEEEISRDRYTVRGQKENLLLTEFQHLLWTDLERGKDIALSAPTSAGKSFVIQQFLASKIEKREISSALYLVPTRALISQVSEDLRVRLGSESNTEIMTMPPEQGMSLPDSSIFVLTQERTQLLLEDHASFDPDVVVVDEAQNVQDGSRGVLLHWVIDEILSRENRKQTLFASPMVSNPEIFSHLFDAGEVLSVTTNAPAVSQNIISVHITQPNRGVVEFFKLDPRRKQKVSIGTQNLGKKLSSRKDRLLEVSASISGGGPSIIYADGPKTAETHAISLANILLHPDDEGESHKDQSFENLELARFSREVVHEDFALADCLSAGVAYHYGVMPTSLRIAIEEAFKAGKISYLVCTTTLLQGVNLPARNILLCHPKKGRNDHLKGVDFWNLAGRAGRLLKDFHGNVFLVDHDKWDVDPLEEITSEKVSFSIESILSENEEDLIFAISGMDKMPSKIDGIESAFTRLFSDFLKGKARSTLERVTSGDVKKTNRVLEALGEAGANITLPASVINRSGGVSPHRLQSLKDEMMERLNNGDFSSLIPKHPRDNDAYKSYCEIIQTCRQIFLGVEDRTHTFHALMATRWMAGWPLPRIIQAGIERNKEKKSKDVIYETLEVIERNLRFTVNQMFASYTSILEHILEEKGLSEKFDAVPSLSTYLEVGACDQTAISLMSIGLSRPVALKVTEVAPRKDMDVESALKWLERSPRSLLSLSSIMELEVDNLLRGRTRV